MNNININRNNIKINTDKISGNKLSIQTLDSKHQVLSGKYDKSSLKFHVETEQKDFDWHWPADSVITYKKKLVDTHNSFDINSGTFTAPFDGKFGFLFFALFTQDTGCMPVFHNTVAIDIFCRADLDFNQASSAYFALDLKKNDKVKMGSGDAEINLLWLPAKFMGFLLQ